MTNDNLNSSLKPGQSMAAKVVGLSNLFAMAIVVFGNYRLLNPLIVRGSAAETARNILAHPTQLRAALACFLVYSGSVVVLTTALYIILKPVNRGLALAGALFRLVFAGFWLLTALNLLTALRLIGTASYLRALEPERLQALARVQIAGTFDDYYVGLPFAAAATVCSYLWLRSAYIPKAWAVFGLVSSGWCLVCAFAFLVFPDFGKSVNPYWFDTPMAMFELGLSFWLLLRGLNSTPVAAANPFQADAV